MKKTLLISLVVIFLGIGYLYQYRRQQLAVLSGGVLPLRDPYATLRSNIGDFEQTPEDDAIWHSIYVMYDPEVERHRELYQTAFAFFKGYDLAAKGWQLQTTLRNDFETFLQVHGTIYPEEIEIGEFIS